jgi:hypothetical protein
MAVGGVAVGTTGLGACGKVMDSMNASDSVCVRFPALTFNGGSLGVVESMDQLTRPSRLGVKGGFYKRLVVVDSNLQRLHVVRAEKVGTHFDANFRTVLRLIGGNLVWQMKITFGSPSSISLEGVKRLISDCFQRNEEYWDEMSDFEIFRNKIAAADSLERVFAVFREFDQF